MISYWNYVHCVDCVTDLHGRMSSNLVKTFFWWGVDTNKPSLWGVLFLFSAAYKNTLVIWFVAFLSELNKQTKLGSTSQVKNRCQRHWATVSKYAVNHNERWIQIILPCSTQVIKSCGVAGLINVLNFSVLTIQAESFTWTTTTTLALVIWSVGNQYMDDFIKCTPILTINCIHKSGIILDMSNSPIYVIAQRLPVIIEPFIYKKVCVYTLIVHFNS